MITDPRVFEEGHKPRRLLHRESAVATVLRRSSPTPEQGCGDVLLHGPSGVGKTVLAAHCARRLATEQSVHTTHVDALGTSDLGVVRSILRQLPGENPASNSPAADTFTMLYERVDSPTLVVLDEGDDLPGTDVLDRLFDVAQLGVIVICHDPDAWLAGVDQRVRDRLGSATLGLDRYGVSELADILEARARAGLAPNSVSRAHLETIADEVAGVARDGIQTLVAAARESQRRGYSQIREDLLADAYELAQHRIRTQQLHSLPMHHQILYEIVREHGPLRGEELHNRYEAVADAVYDGLPQTPIGERERRRKLQKLIDYDLLVPGGENRNRAYQVCDSDIEVREHFWSESVKSAE